MEQKEWSEPKKSSLINNPKGWYGGEVMHTGGNIMCRIWRNKDFDKIYNKEVDEYKEVIYGKPFDGVTVDKYEKDEDGLFVYKGEIEREAVKENRTDEKCAEVAKKLMKKH